MSGLRIFLAPLAVQYGFAVSVRNLLFDIGVLPVTKVSVPVVSVGNLSAGGTGKTPLVEHLARYFKERGKKVAIISRGYKRNTTGYVVVSNGAQRCAEAAESGDEPSQLAEKLDGVIVVVDEKRVRAAERVVAAFKPGLILLDDGFQHRYLHRDLNIAIVTKDEALSGSWLLPMGDRREQLSALKRADVIVVSRCDHEQTFTAARERFAHLQKPIVGMKVYAKSLVHALTGAHADIKKVAGTRVVAFSGIGNPDQFEQTLESLSLTVARHHRFADHHRFAGADLEAVRRSYLAEQAEMILTTEKDRARLKGDASGSDFLKQNPVYYIDARVEVLWGKDQFETMLAEYI